MKEDRFGDLTERQRRYLRLVFQHHTSDAIAQIDNVSARAVDKQVQKARDLIGATSRSEAARLFAEHEAGVEEFYPASVLPSHRPFWPLPMPVPTKSEATNTLDWKQVLAWGAIIAIAAPAGITLAATVILAISLLVGTNPR